MTAPAAIAPAVENPMMFVVVQVRQTLQHAGAIGANSEALVLIAAMRPCQTALIPLDDAVCKRQHPFAVSSVRSNSAGARGRDAAGFPA
jgi:hypothetical protein